MGEPIEGTEHWTIERYGGHSAPTAKRSPSRFVYGGDVSAESDGLDVSIDVRTDMGSFVAETMFLPDAVLLALGYVRAEAERERVRTILEETRSNFGSSFLAVVAINSIATRLGIDLRQPAGKGDDNG